MKKKQPVARIAIIAFVVVIVLVLAASSFGIIDIKL